MIVINKCFNILLGFVLVIILNVLFHKNPNVHAPDSNVVRKQVFRNDNKCYVLEPIIYVCPLHSRAYASAVSGETGPILK